MRVEIYHDILARKVFEQASPQEQMRLRIERFVEERFQHFKSTQGLLGKEDLEYIRPYLAQLDLEESRLNFIKRSQRAEKRRKRRLVGFLLSIIIALSLLAAWAVQERVKAQKERDQANANALVNQSIVALLTEKDASKALFLTQKALDIVPGNQSSWRQMYDICYQDANERPYYPLSWTLKSNSAEVPTGIAFSPGGRFISLYNDTIIELWSYDNRLLKTFKFPGKHISEIELSPDDRLLAAVSLEGEVQIWETDSEQLAATWTLEEEIIYDLEFTDCGEGKDQLQILTATNKGNIYWRDTSGKLIRQIHNPAGAIIDIIPLAKCERLITIDSSSQSLKIWNRQGELIQIIREYNKGLALSLSPDKRTFATAWGKKPHTYANIWDSDGQKIATTDPPAHNFWWIYSIHYAPNGRYLATGSADKTVKIWDAAEPSRRLAVLSGHTGRVYQVRFSPDSRSVLTGSEDGTAKIWNLEGELIADLAHSNTQKVTSAYWSPDGRHALTILEDGKSVKIWNLQPFEQVLDQGRGLVTDLVVSPYGKRVASANQDGRLKLWTLEGRSLHSFELSVPLVNVLAFSSEGRYLAAGSLDGQVFVWDLQEMDDPVSSPLANISLGDPVNALIFSNDGLHLLVAGGDRATNTGFASWLHWNAKERRLESAPISTKSLSTVFTAALSPDNKTAAIGDVEGKLYFWQIMDKGATIKPLNSNENFQKEIVDIAFSPRGKYVASIDEDSSLVIWTSEGKIHQTIRQEMALNTVTFSQDGQFLIVGGRGRKVFVWDLSGAKIDESDDNEAAIISLDLAKKGRVFASGSANPNSYSDSQSGQLRAADIRLGQLNEAGELFYLARLSKHTDAVNKVCFTPDGRFLISGGYDGRVIAWPLAEQLLETLHQRGLSNRNLSKN